jgi:hypothetical protein
VPWRCQGFDIIFNVLLTAPSRLDPNFHLSLNWPPSLTYRQQVEIKLLNNLVYWQRTPPSNLTLVESARLLPTPLIDPTPCSTLELHPGHLFIIIIFI